MKTLEDGQLAQREISEIAGRKYVGDHRQWNSELVEFMEARKLVGLVFEVEGDEGDEGVMDVYTIAGKYVGEIYAGTPLQGSLNYLVGKLKNHKT